MDTKVGNLDVILISNADYETLMPTSKQNIARALARKPGVRVLYVQPGFNLLTSIRNRSFWAESWRYLRYPKPIFWAQEQLAILSTPIQIPFGNRFPWINWINQFLTLMYIRHGMYLLNVSSPLLLIFDYRSGLILKKLHERTSIYYRTDNFIELCAGITGDSNIIQRYEKELINNVNTVFVSAKELSDLPHQLGKNWFYIPHGVDLQRFTRVEEEAPREYLDRGEVIVCYQGSIDRWVDLDLIFEIAQCRPKWSLYLVGPVRQGINVGKLRSLHNIKFVGHVDYTRIPSFIFHSDVCIIPFLVNSLTKGVNPLKLWEYFACGKPVVSTALPEVEICSPLVRIANTTEKFIFAIEDSLLEASNLCEQRMEIAKLHSWDSIANQILSLTKRE